MDTIRQGSNNTVRGNIMGILPLTLPLLLLWLAIPQEAGAAQSAPPPYVYAIQLESSRKPNLDDYQGILHLGTLYTYRDKKDKALIRVRIGYYPTRQDADRALIRIRNKGFHDAYITRIHNPDLQTAKVSPVRQKTRQPPPPKQTAPPRRPAGVKNAAVPGSTTRHYTIQLESSRRPDMTRFNGIRQYGKVYTQKSAKDNKRTYVRMGPFTSLGEARQILGKVKAAGFHDAYIIRTRQPAAALPTRKKRIEPAAEPAKPAAPEAPARPVAQAAKPAQDGHDTPHLYAIHVTTTEDTDMSHYDPIRSYGVVYMSYRYSRKKSERNQIRIMAGYYEDQTEAQTALARIKTAGFPDARIVAVPDRSKMNQNRRNITRPRPRPARPDAVEDTASATKPDPFVPALQPNADPFTGK